jgi:hypothetical protein
MVTAEPYARALLRAGRSAVLGREPVLSCVVVQATGRRGCIENSRSAALPSAALSEQRARSRVCPQRNGKKRSKPVLAPLSAPKEVEDFELYTRGP